MSLYRDYRGVENVVTDAAAINNSIKNILLTPKGSLPGKPEFGSNMYKVLFSQIDTITKGILIRYIKEALTRWEKRIILSDVSVNFIPEFNKITATISYIYRDAGLDINEKISISIVQ